VAAFDGSDDSPADLSADYKRYLWADDPAPDTGDDKRAGRTAG
jgi:hypothetical protein